MIGRFLDILIEQLLHLRSRIQIAKIDSLSPEELGRLKLSECVNRANKSVNEINKAKRGWRAINTLEERVVLGLWLSTAHRHFDAILILSEDKHLSTVANLHYRQMLEILLEVRAFLNYPRKERERVAQEISILATLKYLQKWDVVKEHEKVKDGYQEMEKRLKLYDSQIVDKIKKKKGK